MNPLAISPKASALARYLHDRTSTVTDLDDLAAAAELELEPNTVYKALQELAQLHALTFSRRRGGLRRVARDPEHWLWLAMEQTANDKAVTL